jgi:hypothetical protein
MKTDVRKLVLLFGIDLNIAHYLYSITYKHAPYLFIIVIRIMEAKNYEVEVPLNKTSQQVRYG